jgi:hypothetical protein
MPRERVRRGGEWSPSEMEGKIVVTCTIAVQVVRLRSPSLASVVKSFLSPFANQSPNPPDGFITPVAWTESSYMMASLDTSVRRSEAARFRVLLQTKVE